LLNEDGRIETVLLPIRDGLTISRVKHFTDTVSFE
jgi:predicted O-methyltransferase YrrM